VQLFPKGAKNSICERIVMIYDTQLKRTYVLEKMNNGINPEKITPDYGIRNTANEFIY
jgi:hypothetical protein